MKNLIIPTLFAIFSNIYGTSPETPSVKRYEILPPRPVAYVRMWNWILQDGRKSQNKEKPVLGVGTCDLESPYESLNSALQNVVVSAYGSDKTYLSAAKKEGIGESDSSNLIAKELVSQCQDALGGLVNIQNLKLSNDEEIQLKLDIGIRNLSKNELINSQIDSNLPYSLDFDQLLNAKGSFTQFERNGAHGHPYHFSKIPVLLSEKQKLVIYNSLIAEGSCAEGNLYIDDIVKFNKCQELIEKIEKRIKRTRGGIRSVVVSLSAVACASGRRFSGGAIKNGSIIGALTCSLSEVISSAGCESALKISEQAAKFSALTYLAYSLPNGSALKDADLDFLDGGNSFENGKRNRFDNPAGAAIGASLIGYLTGKIYGFAADEKTSLKQSRSNALGFATSYITTAQLANDQFEIAGNKASAISELLTGAIPGAIQASYRNDQCIQKLKGKLGSLLNNSQKESLPSDFLN